MSDFLKKFKSVFVVEDGAAATEKPAAPAAPTAQTTAQTSPQPVQNSTPVYSPPISSGVANEKFVQILSAAMEAANQEGFDYLEYKNSLRSLEKMPMDEATRFQSAYAMATTMGATPQKLVDSAKFYLGVLNGEESKFNQTAQAQRSKLIGNKEAEIQNLDAAVKQKADQIKRLTEEIAAHQKHMELLRQEISDATVKVEAASKDFHATFSIVANQINDDIQKMSSYLK